MYTITLDISLISLMEIIKIKNITRFLVQIVAFFIKNIGESSEELNCTMYYF